MVVVNRRSSRFFASLSLTLAFLIVAPIANADILFEGFSKVLLDNVHVGYVIQRYEFDSKKKEFATSYYLKTNAAGGGLTESLKARADSSFKPLGYQYTSAQADQTKTIDANFKGDVMTAVVHEGKKPEQLISKKIPKGTFLASFLGYVMLQGKEGIKKGVKYSYKAIAEEDGSIEDGQAFVSAEDTLKNINTFKVLNTFKHVEFASWVTAKGEVIATSSPVQKIETQLVATLQEATAGQAVNTNTISLLFGSLPKGKDNIIARRALEAPAPIADSQKAQIPAGKGIQVKGAPPPSSEAPASTQDANPGTNPDAHAPKK